MDKVINQGYVDLLNKMIEVRQFIKQENIDKREVTLEQAKEKWPELSEQNKVLLEQCVGKEMDFNKIVYMFRLKTLVAEGKISDYDASVVHGKMVYDTYMKKD
jgi:hypothetical protein